MGALEFKTCLLEFYTWEISSPSPHGQPLCSLYQTSHKTIVNLKLNYTPILLSPACEFTSKSCDMGGRTGGGAGGLFFSPSLQQIIVFLDIRWSEYGGWTQGLLQGKA